MGEVSRLPVCLRIVLESLLRNYDGKKIQESDITTLASWNRTQSVLRRFLLLSQECCSKTYRRPPEGSGGDALSRGPNGEVSGNHRTASFL